MATFTLSESTGDRAFHVPFDGPMPGWPWRAGGELVVRAEGPEARPVAIELRFVPGAFEFQAHLPELAQAFSEPISPFDLGRQAAGAQPVVIYAGEPDTLAAVPPGLLELADMEAFLAGRPPLFQPAAYRLAGVAFDMGERPEA